MFIKHGDDNKNKIMTVIEDEDLSEEQKKSSKDFLQKTIKRSNTDNTSEVKKSGDN